MISAHDRGAAGAGDVLFSFLACDTCPDFCAGELGLRSPFHSTQPATFGAHHSPDGDAYTLGAIATREGGGVIGNCNSSGCMGCGVLAGTERGGAAHKFGKRCAKVDTLLETDCGRTHCRLNWFENGLSVVWGRYFSNWSSELRDAYHHPGPQ